MAVNDELFQNLSTVQSSLSPSPPTIASAATVTINNFLTFITGTTQIATINPPVSGAHMLVLVFTNGAPGALLTTGNIKAAVSPAQNVPILAIYDPVTAKYWCGILKAS